MLKNFRIPPFSIFCTPLSSEIQTNHLGTKAVISFSFIFYWIPEVLINGELSSPIPPKGFPLTISSFQSLSGMLSIPPLNHWLQLSVRSLKTEQSLYFAFFGNLSSLLVFPGMILYHRWVLPTLFHQSIGCLESESRSTHNCTTWTVCLGHGKHLKSHWIKKIKNFLCSSCEVLIWFLLFQLTLSLQASNDFRK